MPAACNTLYIGIMQLNEHIFNDSPIWIAKKSNQFVPLSYHELDKNTLGDVWNKDYDNYFIS
jgi:ABC-type microcin C transport system permease subunit YejE